MNRPFALVVALAGLSIAAAQAAEPAPNPAKERRICRGATKSLGSHIRSTRRCRTAEQWQQEDEERGRLPTSMQVTPGQNDGQAPRQPQ
jgi:hypothetical protein